jgi:hypothetical protein
MSTVAPASPPTTSPPAAADAEQRTGGPSTTKLTVNITRRANVALSEASGTNGESKTNVVNRAIQAYALLTRMMANGWDLVLKDQDGNEQQVHFL